MEKEGKGDAYLGGGPNDLHDKIRVRISVGVSGEFGGNASGGSGVWVRVKSCVGGGGGGFLGRSHDEIE